MSFRGTAPVLARRTTVAEYIPVGGLQFTSRQRVHHGQRVHMLPSSSRSFVEESIPAAHALAQSHHHQIPSVSMKASTDEACGGDAWSNIFGSFLPHMSPADLRLNQQKPSSRATSPRRGGGGGGIGSPRWDKKDENQICPKNGPNKVGWVDTGRIIDFICFIDLICFVAIIYVLTLGDRLLTI